MKKTLIAEAVNNKPKLKWVDYTLTINNNTSDNVPKSGIYKGPGRPDILDTTNGTLTGVTLQSGDKYLSTDGAGTGAWEWTYINGKWKVTTGDTGWRYVSAVKERTPTTFNLNNYNLNESYKELIFDYIKFRRINDTVLYEIGSEDNLDPKYKQESIPQEFINQSNRNSIYKPATIGNNKNIFALKEGFRPLSDKKIGVQSTINSFPNANSTFVICSNKKDKLIRFVGKDTKILAKDKTILPEVNIKLPYILGNTIQYKTSINPGEDSSTALDTDVNMISIPELETSIKKVISDNVESKTKKVLKIKLQNLGQSFYNNNKLLMDDLNAIKAQNHVIGCDIVNTINVISGSNNYTVYITKDARFTTVCNQDVYIPITLENRKNLTYETLLKLYNITDITEISINNNGVKEIIDKTTKLNPEYFYILTNLLEKANRLISPSFIKINTEGTTTKGEAYNTINFRSFDFTGTLTDEVEPSKLLLNVSVYKMTLHEKIAKALGLPQIIGYDKINKRKFNEEFDIDLQDVITIEAKRIVDNGTVYYTPIKDYYINHMYVTNMRYRAQKYNVNFCNLILNSEGGISSEITMNIATPDTAAPGNIKWDDFNLNNIHVLNNNNWISLFELVQWDYTNNNSLTVPTKLCKKESIEYITGDEWPILDSLTGIPYENRVNIGTWKTGIPYEKRSN